jgi:radical SAM superfamily enzyme YgiQ (UPF0313 family)
MPVMPIGACIVAHALEAAGHSVQFLDLMFARDASQAIVSALTDFQPDAVGISIRNIDNVDMRHPVYFLDDLADIVGAIRSRSDAPLVLGGAALGIMPEQILRLAPGALAVVGAGEIVLPRLLQRIAHAGPYHDLPGVVYLQDGVLHRNSQESSEYATSCPVPDYQRWLDTRAYRFQMATVPLQTKTGCQHNCVYCSYPKIEGSSHRPKDPGSVADAVARLAASGLRDIEIVDSVFNLPREHALEVCAALARVKHGARLQCLELNPRGFDDALVSAMERAGFVGMGITLESASDPVLQGMRKGFTSREAHHAAAVVRRHRIPCAWIFLFGGPGETRETVLETLQFAAEQIRPGDVAFFNTGIRVYPGTELESIARREGILTVSPAEMLTPTFYVAPEVDAGWIELQLKRYMQRQMNFISIDTLGLPVLPFINQIGARLGLRPPHWKHTQLLRRLFRMAGMDV